MNNLRILVTGGSGFIGRHLIDALEKSKCTIFNIDKRRPQNGRHLPYWIPCDILDVPTLRNVVDCAAPTHVVHLAARTDTTGHSLDEYVDNTLGTANVLKVINETQSISRIIITSTQFVHRPGGMPKHDEDFDPHTVYGESKVINEQKIRQMQISAAWTIIRPTNIWGPWHPRYPTEFWKVLKKGLYFHPGKEPVIRSYGYVGNVVAQIKKILTLPVHAINNKVFYVGDRPINLAEWVNEFSLALTGKRIRIVPKGIFYPLALIGDAAKGLSVNFPISSSRYESMTQSYPTPMETALSILGEGPYSLKQGVDETVRWLRTQDPFWSA